MLRRVLQRPTQVSRSVVILSKKVDRLGPSSNRGSFGVTITGKVFFPKSKPCSVGGRLCLLYSRLPIGGVIIVPLSNFSVIVLFRYSVKTVPYV